MPDKNDDKQIEFEFSKDIPKGNIEKIDPESLDMDYLNFQTFDDILRFNKDVKLIDSKVPKFNLHPKQKELFDLNDNDRQSQFDHANKKWKKEINRNFGQKLNELSPDNLKVLFDNIEYGEEFRKEYIKFYREYVKVINIKNNIFPNGKPKIELYAGMDIDDFLELYPEFCNQIQNLSFVGNSSYTNVFKNIINAISDIDTMIREVDVIPHYHYMNNDIQEIIYSLKYFNKDAQEAEVKRSDQYNKIKSKTKILKMQYNNLLASDFSNKNIKNLISNYLKELINDYNFITSIVMYEGEKNLFQIIRIIYNASNEIIKNLPKYNEYKKLIENIKNFGIVNENNFKEFSKLISPIANLHSIDKIPDFNLFLDQINNNINKLNRLIYMNNYRSFNFNEVNFILKQIREILFFTSGHEYFIDNIFYNLKLFGAWQGKLITKSIMEEYGVDFNSAKNIEEVYEFEYSKFDGLLKEYIKKNNGKISKDELKKFLQLDRESSYDFNNIFNNLNIKNSGVKDSQFNSIFNNIILNLDKNIDKSYEKLKEISREIHNHGNDGYSNINLLNDISKNVNIKKYDQAAINQKFIDQIIAIKSIGIEKMEKEYGEIINKYIQLGVFTSNPIEDAKYLLDIFNKNILLKENTDIGLKAKNAYNNLLKLKYLKNTEDYEKYIESAKKKINELYNLNMNINDVLRFRVLEDKDPRHLFVGEETDCCFFIGGASTYSVLDAFLNSHAGILLLEYRSNNDWQLLTQSWFHYIPQDNAYILDNIETDDRAIAKVPNINIGACYAWLANQLKTKMNISYFDIGMAYTEILDQKMFKQTDNKQDPRKKYNLFSSDAEKFADDTDHEFYTDYDPKTAINALYPNFDISNVETFGTNPTTKQARLLRQFGFILFS